MENRQLILFVVLSVLVLLGWEAWQGASAPREPAVAEAPAGPSAEAGGPAPGEDRPPAPEGAAAQQRSAGALARGDRVRVRTDVLAAEIDTVGGDLRRVELLRYPVSLDRPEEPFRLLDDEPGRVFVAQTGVLARTGPSPDHHARFRPEGERYALSEGARELRVPLRWRQGDLELTKTYVFRRDSYVVTVEHRLRNLGAEPWRAFPYRQIQRDRTEPASLLLPTYVGGVVHGEELKYEKVSFDDLADEPLDLDLTGGWVAMMQHYFVAAWLADPGQRNRVYGKALPGDRFLLGMTAPAVEVPAGGELTWTARLYVGPKVAERLAAAAEDLDLTVDYGKLTFLAKPLFWLLAVFHDWTGNWGVAIILLTLAIKLAFYKLSEASYRSMANMRRLQPKLQAIRERYGDDRQRMSQAMMELYKQERINPFGGCLPVLVQIPVFIALYWVLLESVELRQAPFVGWIRDLSAKDPYYVLPLLMGVTMFLQQRLNPAPPDPVQARVMQALPFVFTLFFAFFPAGLVLYWVTNNVLSIAQQWHITRRLEREAERARQEARARKAARAAEEEGSGAGQEAARAEGGDRQPEVAARRPGGPSAGRARGGKADGGKGRGGRGKGRRRKR